MNWNLAYSLLAAGATALTIVAAFQSQFSRMREGIEKSIRIERELDHLKRGKMMQSDDLAKMMDRMNEMHQRLSLLERDQAIAEKIDSSLGFEKRLDNAIARIAAIEGQAKIILADKYGGSSFGG